METPLVISSSSLKLFKECRKAYDLGYVRLLDPVGTESEVVETGTTIHKHLAYAALGEAPSDFLYSETDTEYQTARDYIRKFPLPTDILGVEDAGFFTELIPGRLFVRCTFDLVYRNGHPIVLRDYKTFASKPTPVPELDFQGRFYATAGWKHYKQRVDFEYEYIRQCGYHLKKGEPDYSNPWEDRERYLHIPVSLSKYQAEQTWGEAQYVGEQLLAAHKENGPYTWYHTDRKGWNGCQSCFYRLLCETEDQHGGLSPQDISSMSRPRQPLVLPT